MSPNPDVKAVLGIALDQLALGMKARARKLLDALAGVAPDDAEVLLALGTVCFEEGDLAGARAPLERCVTLAPANALANAILGEIDLREGRPQAALPRLRAAAATEIAPLRARVAEMLRAASAASELAAT